MWVCQTQQVEVMSHSPMETFKPEMSKPELLKPSEGEGFHQKENPEHIWNLSMGAACASVCVSWGSWLGLLTARWLTFLTHMVWNEHGGVFFVWHLSRYQTFHKLVSFIETAESYQNSAWSSRSVLSGHAHASKPCCIRAKSILTLDLLWNEVCKDTIRPQGKPWSLPSARQRCGSAREAVASVVLVGNQPGENSFTGSHLLAASERWSEGRQHGAECVSTLQMMIEIRMFSAGTENTQGVRWPYFYLDLQGSARAKSALLKYKMLPHDLLVLCNKTTAMVVSHWWLLFLSSWKLSLRCHRFISHRLTFRFLLVKVAYRQ